MNTERDPLCAVPSCLDNCPESEGLCTTHWGELPAYWQAEIRRAWDAVESAAPGPDRIAARVDHAGIVERAAVSIAEEAA